MQRSFSQYHQYYDKISRDNKAVEQKAKDKGWIVVVSNFHKHSEVKVKGNSVVFHSTHTKSATKNSVVWFLL